MFNVDYKPTKRPLYKIMVSKAMSFILRVCLLTCLCVAPFLERDRQNILAFCFVTIGLIAAIWVVYFIYTDEDRP